MKILLYILNLKKTPSMLGHKVHMTKSRKDLEDFRVALVDPSVERKDEMIALSNVLEKIIEGQNGATFNALRDTVILSIVRIMILMMVIVYPFISAFVDSNIFIGLLELLFEATLI